MILIFYFFFWTYTRADLIGGFEGMYNLLQQASIERPVAGNQDGSYLTLKSNCELSLTLYRRLPTFFRWTYIYDYSNHWWIWYCHAGSGSLFGTVKLNTC